MSRFLVTFLTLVLFGFVQHARGGDELFNATKLDQVSARLTEFVDNGQISGAVALVATQDHIVRTFVVGQADIENQQAMTEEAIFRIASMTKPITAVALMQLVEQGKLAIDDPVSKYIVAFKALQTADGTVQREVTIRDVVTHTAGLGSFSREESEGLSLEQIVERIASKPLTFAPGSKWSYSSGLTVAGRLIEIASGQSYAEYIRDKITAPLGMTDTAFQLTSAQAQRLAVNYDIDKDTGKLRPAPSRDATKPVTPNPSGGLYSTASDMAKFYQAILNEGHQGEVQLLPVESVKTMLANHTADLNTGFTPGNCWGLGWCVLENPQGVTRLLAPGTYGHGGAWGTQGWTDPQRGLVLVLMVQRMNFGNSDGSAVRDAFNEAVLTAYQGPESAGAKRVAYHNYDAAIELNLADAKAVLCPQVGGRVLEFSVGGVNAMYLDEQEQNWKPGTPNRAGAGRFDFGPELITPQHPSIWSGEWSAEITGPTSARLTSQQDPATGIQVLRDYSLERTNDQTPVTLHCKQTLMNVSNEVKEVCHWGRSFSPAGGICLVPLLGISKFPSKYAMYEESWIINVKNTDNQIRERDGFIEILAPPRKPKLGFDSQAGYLAYVLPSNRMFVKRFATYPDRVYSEAAGLTLSVWSPSGPMIELEPIGPRERLAPGEVASFTEDWSLLEFPFPNAGEQIDLKRVRELIEGRATE